MNIANYIIENNATVRQTAKEFGISKSTVHKDVTERLAQLNPSLAAEARKVLDVNKSERHIRGGLLQPCFQPAGHSLHAMFRKKSVVIHTPG